MSKSRAIIDSLACARGRRRRELRVYAPLIGPAASLSIPAQASAAERAILYYRDPTGAPFWSATPKNDAQGRAYLARL